MLIALIIAPINCYFQIQMELVRHTELSCVVPLSNVIFILMAVMVINYLIRWLTPSIALRKDELLVLYVMLSLTTTLSAYDVLQPVLSVLEHAFWFATPENEYKELFLWYIPRWLTVSDKQALEGYYEGNSSFYLTENLKVWAPVILAWLLLFSVLAFIFLCLNTILRRQWTEHEKLTYPIIQLPLEMTNPSSGFFRNKLMWIGFALAFGIDLLNGLSYLYPTIPCIPVKRRYFFFSEPPLSFYGSARTALYPFAIGIMFLMPLDLLFSASFFYVLKRNLLALSEAMGWHNFPKLHEQGFGAFFGFCVFLFWVGRHHFKSVLKKIFKREAELDDAEEPIPYRAAVFGLFLGLILFAFLLHKAGMGLWLAGIFAILFLITPIITTRLRAEAGIPEHEFLWEAPRYMLITALGTRRLGPQNLTTLTVCFFNRNYRTQQMPHQLEAFKISEQANIKKRRMFFAILIATAIGVFLGFWAQLHLYYKFGAASGYFRRSLGYGRWFFGQLKDWIYYPTNTDWMGVLFMGVGFSVMALLTYLRTRFFWLPLHPLGYVMAFRENRDLWMPILICLVLKWLILRFGGIRSYRRAVPFFLGLVLGEFLMGCIWGIFGVVFNTTIYQFYP